MVFLFRDKSAINIFSLVILSIGVHLHFFFSPPVVVTGAHDGVFSLFLREYVSTISQSFLFVLYHIIVLLQAIRLNMVLSDLRMYQYNTYTPAMAYVLLSGILIQWCNISSALVANFMLIWLFIKLSRLYNHPSPKTLLFNTGLIVGLSVICYHPTAILIPVVLFALAVVRPFRLAEWVILLMGILLPYYFLFSILYLKGTTGGLSSFIPFLQWNLPLQKWDAPLVIRLFVLLFSLVAGLVYWQIFNKRMVIQIRKNWGVMMGMLLILLPVPFLFPGAGIESAFMALLPLGAFAANAFTYPRRLVLPNILFWLALAILAYNNWIMIKN